MMFSQLLYLLPKFAIFAEEISASAGWQDESLIDDLVLWQLYDRPGWPTAVYLNLKQKRSS
jgi:hypothetical protein